MSRYIGPVCRLCRQLLGFGLHFWLNILLTICGYFPGIIHAVYIIAKK